MRVFISYCNTDGLTYAAKSASILENHGCETWYFDRDKTPGVQRIDDITYHIRHWCELIIFLCSQGSINSRGQKEEIGHWDRTNKQIIVIPIDEANVPESIDTRIYTKVSSVGFAQGFEDFVNNRFDRAITMFEQYNRAIEVESV